MLYHQSTPDQMFLSAAVRNQWVAFENWLVAPRGATEQRRTELLTTLQEDFLKNLRSTADTFHPMLQQDYENNKMRLNLHLDEELVLLAQLEWDRRLSKAGLKPEDWIDMTPAERHSVERLLGGAIEDEQFAVVDSDPGALPSTSTLQTPITHPVPTPNGSPYTFVNPRAFGGEEEDVAEDDTDEDDPSLDNFIFPVDAVSTSRRTLTRD
jgi:hypothetical protein